MPSVPCVSVATEGAGPGSTQDSELADTQQ